MEDGATDDAEKEVEVGLKPDAIDSDLCKDAVFVVRERVTGLAALALAFALLSGTTVDPL